MTFSGSREGRVPSPHDEIVAMHEDRVLFAFLLSVLTLLAREEDCVHHRAAREATPDLRPVGREDAHGVTFAEVAAHPRDADREDASSFRADRRGCAGIEPDVASRAKRESDPVFLRWEAAGI